VRDMHHGHASWHPELRTPGIPSKSAWLDPRSSPNGGSIELCTPGRNGLGCYSCNISCLAQGKQLWSALCCPWLRRMNNSPCTTDSQSVVGRPWSRSRSLGPGSAGPVVRTWVFRKSRLLAAAYRWRKPRISPIIASTSNSDSS
jgi:hypothetical protein